MGSAVDPTGDRSAMAASGQQLIDGALAEFFADQSTTELTAV